MRPDGDIDFKAVPDFSAFKLPKCFSCNSATLKPDVVFFGESVDKSNVERSYQNITEVRIYWQI
jgi:NAD-dependent SIR2 family protein deacetylase